MAAFGPITHFAHQGDAVSKTLKAATAWVCGGMLGIVAGLVGAGGAHADGPGGPVQVGDSLYFALGEWNCSIGDNGAVGCDLAAPATMNVLYTGVQVPFPNVPAIVIDSTALPAHPEWNSNGSHTLPGGNPGLAALTQVSGHDPQFSVTHAGATCQITWNGSAICTSLGHGFSQRGPEPFGY
ncbi:hypothetical protein GPX89_10415 [Nocardia sp. ET3-3]|uniref:Uncharacterized protein n=1 Tax=Nocardia terrae TaxID=2675851 RepID=A0A7K1UTF8_9NOCA|nr:hypothetical protein [Nocardia terrae]MVU77652.1 hypothetical protein [Nocardia terrae]